MNLALTVLFLVAALYRPDLFLYIFVVAYVAFYEYFSYAMTPFFMVGGLKIYLGDVFFAIFVLLVASRLMNKERAIKFNTPLDKAMILYCAWILICVLRGYPEWGTSAFGEFRHVMWAFLYFPISLILKDEKQVRRFLRICMYIVIAYTVYLLMYRYFIQFEQDLFILLRSRIAGADLSLLLTSVFVIIASMFLADAVDRKKSVLIGIMVFCGATIMLGARTGMVAWAVSNMFIVLIYMRNMTVLLRPSVLFTMAVMVAIVMYFNPFESHYDAAVESYAAYGAAHRSGFEALFSTSALAETDTFAWRIVGWENLFYQTLSLNPFFGEGFGGYYDIYEVSMKGVPPHNEYLIIFSKMGIVGIVLFLYLMARYFVACFNYLSKTEDRIRRSYVKGLMAVTVSGLIGGIFFAFFPYMWLAMGLQSTFIRRTATTDT